MKLDSRITILTGHFGSGKTELALNFAINEAMQHERTAIADLDVINPYFRTRDIYETLKERGVELIGPSKRLASSDLPIVSGEIYRIMHDPSYRLIIDAGGEKDGATVLGQYYNDWQSMAPKMLFVLNANRPYVSTVRGVAEAIQGIENAARLPVTGIINNTNLAAVTSADDVLKGERLALSVSEQLGIPFSGTAIFRGLKDRQEFRGRTDVCVIDRYMKLPWE